MRPQSRRSTLYHVTMVTTLERSICLVWSSSPQLVILTSCQIKTRSDLSDRAQVVHARPTPAAASAWEQHNEAPNNNKNREKMNLIIHDPQI